MSGLDYLFPDFSGLLDTKMCCAALYEAEPLRALLGDTLHPGGLALTHRLGKIAGIQRGDRVLDVACGRGTSALAVARSFHCRVLGLDLGGQSIAEATLRANEARVGTDVAFVRGDAERLPLLEGTFDAVLCECSMSLFPDKVQGVAEMARLLRPGGRLAISDVTVDPGTLPDELKGTLGQALCLGGALSIEGYRDLLGDEVTLVHDQDASDSILSLLAEIEAKLAGLRLLQSLQGSDPGPDLLSLALPFIERAKALVTQGSIGYWLFVAEKPSRNQAHV